MISRKMVLYSVLSAVMIVTFTSVMAAPGQGRLSSDISMAEQALADDQYDDAISLMENHIESSLGKTQGARVRYLLALALFHKTHLDINECRERGEIGSRLKTEQGESMKRAKRYFLESQEMDPESERAADCLYFAGVIQDYGCLNHFEDAMNTFRKLLDLYPGSEYAEDARFRVDKLVRHSKPGSGKMGGFH